jgi:hypothetical protein
MLHLLLDLVIKGPESYFRRKKKKKGVLCCSVSRKKFFLRLPWFLLPCHSKFEHREGKISIVTSSWSSCLDETVEG